MTSPIFPGRVLVLDRPDSYLLKFLQDKGFEVWVETEATFADLVTQLFSLQGILFRSRWRLQAPFFEAAPNLKFIGRLGVGTEHIDMALAQSRGIAVFTTPEASCDTVAEHTIGLMLMLLHNLGKGDREIRAGLWERKANQGTELKGKTVGILGYGNMGRAVAKRLTAFGVNLLIRDIVTPDPLPDFGRMVEEKIFQQETDILSLHIPYTRENHYFANHSWLQGFAKDFILINTARGGILDTAALVECLQSGKVRGAALDVLEYEEGSFDKLDLSKLPETFRYLQQSDRVVLNPHLAGLSIEASNQHARIMAEKLAHWFNLEINAD